MTGLETAIILVAFVITASAFAYVVLNVGFLTAEKTQSVISSGMSEASSALYLDSDVIGSFANNTGSQSDVCMTKAIFYVSLGQGNSPIEMSASKVVITYTNPRCHASVYDTNGTITTITQVTGDGDNVIESGERFKVSIDFTELSKSNVEPSQSTQSDVYTHPHEEIRIDLRPSTGAVLTIKRNLPQIAHTVQAF